MNKSKHSQMEKDLLKMTARMNRFGFSLPVVKDYVLQDFPLALRDP